MEQKPTTDIEIGECVDYTMKKGETIHGEVTKVFEKDFHGTSAMALNLKLSQPRNGKSTMIVRASLCVVVDSEMDDEEVPEVGEEILDDDEEVELSSVNCNDVRSEQPPKDKIGTEVLIPIMKRSELIVKFKAIELIQLLDELNKSGNEFVSVELEKDKQREK